MSTVFIYCICEYFMYTASDRPCFIFILALKTLTSDGCQCLGDSLKMDWFIVTFCSPNRTACPPVVSLNTKSSTLALRHYDDE